jgi:hypothetical protein
MYVNDNTSNSSNWNDNNANKSTNEIHTILIQLIHIYILADYPALSGYLFIPIFYQTGNGTMCSVKS